MESAMNVKSQHTSNQLLKMYKTEPNSRLARRIQGHTCPEIMKIIGAGRRTIQQWVQKYWPAPVFCTSCYESIPHSFSFLPVK